jgi:SHS2 domain-containing protein
LRVDGVGLSRYDVAGEKKNSNDGDNMKPYEYLEHTADMGLLVRGKSLSELLTHAAQGLFETIAVVDTIDETETIEIHLTAESVEELFVTWLDELIFQHETKEIFFKRATVQQCSETEISATVYGEPTNFDKHEVYTEIKSVTYHQLEVLQKPDGSWRAQVIFDL